ncbi:hypothetical protein [Mesorhizobium sp. M1322]|uniref:hypothetical protein n=1 Tax=Mesorhizobium sp. M1322 TaxID=2957081 RepID=UPI00333D76DA
MTSHHQEVLTSLVARYEILVSIQDRIVEHDRRFGLASEVDEGLLERLFDSLGKARIAARSAKSPVFRSLHSY